MSLVHNDATYRHPEPEFQGAVAMCGMNAQGMPFTLMIVNTAGNFLCMIEIPRTIDSEDRRQLFLGKWEIGTIA